MLIEIEVIEEIVMMSVLKGMEEIDGLREISKVRKKEKRRTIRSLDGDESEQKKKSWDSLQEEDKASGDEQKGNLPNGQISSPEGKTEERISLGNQSVGHAPLIYRIEKKREKYSKKRNRPSKTLL